jgi:FixJ family two-component response regulator
VSERVPTIVVVDDDTSVRRSLARLLRSTGYRVETFASARDFLERDDGDGPDCLVIDVSMPGQGGLELYGALTASGHRVPVVFITGHADIPIPVGDGIVSLLPKPCDEQALLDAVQRAIAKDRSPRRDVSPGFRS